MALEISCKDPCTVLMFNSKTNVMIKLRAQNVKPLVARKDKGVYREVSMMYERKPPLADFLA
jgi:hypothetical protein